MVRVSRGARCYRVRGRDDQRTVPSPTGSDLYLRTDAKGCTEDGRGGRGRARSMAQRDIVVPAKGRRRRGTARSPAAAATSAAVAIPFKKRPDTLLFACVNIPRVSERVCLVSLSLALDAKETDRPALGCVFGIFLLFHVARKHREKEERGKRRAVPVEDPVLACDTKTSSRASPERLRDIATEHFPQPRSLSSSYPSTVLFGARRDRKISNNAAGVLGCGRSGHTSENLDGGHRRHAERSRDTPGI